MLSDSHSYFSAALSGEGSTAAVLAGLPVALAGAICVTRKFRCATDVTTPPPPARRRHSPAGEASPSLCQIRSPRVFGSSCVLCRSIGPPPRSLARGGRIRIRSARLQKARGLDTCACSHVSSSEFPTQPVVERGRIDYYMYSNALPQIPQSGPHYIGSYDIPFASTVRSGFGCSAPRGYHASSVSSRPPFGFAPRRGPPRPAPPRPSGAGPRAPPDNQSRGGSLVVVRAGARESPNDLRRLRAPPAGSGTRRGGAAGAAHRNTQTQFACRRAADVGPARGRHPIPRAEHQKWTRALHSSGVLRYLFSMGMRL